MRLPIHRDEHEPGLGMTAMVDVVFLLLIFFIWNSSLEIPEFDLPSALAAPPQGTTSSITMESPPPFDEVVVRIVFSDAGVVFRLNQRSMTDLASLRGEFEKIAAIGATPAVIVDPDPPVTMEDAIAVYDAARSAGFDRVLFAATQ